MTTLHVPRIVGIVAVLAILSYANAETKGLIVALVAVTLLTLAVTHIGGVTSLAAGPAAGLRKVIKPPVGVEAVGTATPLHRVGGP
jgi:hypothetical protein